MTQERTSMRTGRALEGYDPWMSMVEALRASCTSPNRAGADADGQPSPEVIQTHASIVIIASERVYKLKKPKNFGFFDYSTPARRRHFCQQEVILNTELAPGVYLGVAPVLAGKKGQFRFGEPMVPVTVPQPGTMIEGMIVVDYAVVMVRLPESATLERFVREGRATVGLLEDVARFIAAFHARARTDKQIASFGELEVIGSNWEENFAQMRPYLGRTLDEGTYERIRSFVHRFLQSRQPLFASRVREGRIRDGHGDLRLQHLYLLPDPARRSEPSIMLLDRIEFTERFRCGDVAGEVAFLAMELDARSRTDLADAFLCAYIAETGDTTLREILPFYLCYRACVRGKVTSFQLDEQEVPLAQREQAREQARALFALAAHYASSPSEPLVVLVGGLMGTGKSTLAHALQEAMGAMLLSSDLTRKRLAGLTPRQPQAEAFGHGVYTPEWTRRTYRALGAEMEEALKQGHSVLLDASFLRRADRQRMARLASGRGALVLFLECVCPRDIALARLARRWSERLQNESAPRASVALASDGRPELFEQQQEQWEPFSSAAEPLTRHVFVSTDQSRARSLEQALDAIGWPRLACRIDG